VLNQLDQAAVGHVAHHGRPFGWRYYPVLTDSVINALQNNAVTYLTLLSDGAVGFNAKRSATRSLKRCLAGLTGIFPGGAQAAAMGVGSEPGRSSARRFDYQYEAVAAAMLGDRTRAQAAWDIRAGERAGSAANVLES
jgi:hypothetical protein